MVSLMTAKTDEDSKAIPLPASTFKTTANFNIIAYAVMIILVILYAVFW